ncbi:MAG: exodeoxyribonuclease VII small subunit [Lachnospiraceae bacterium]|nr:exodeoxyribonuclease VII small subunit [Lachnospiraceae bacterium]
MMENREKKGTEKLEKEKKTEREIQSLEESSVEEALERLNQIICSLDGEISLEESFRLYREGVQLLQYCNAKVDLVEKQMIVLNGAENQDEF